MSSSTRLVVTVARKRGPDFIPFVLHTAAPKEMDVPEVELDNVAGLVGLLLDLTVPPDRRPSGCIAEPDVNRAVWGQYEEGAFCTVVTQGTPTRASVRHLHLVLDPGGWVFIIGPGTCEGLLAESGFIACAPINLDSREGAFHLSRGSRVEESEPEMSLAELFGWE